MNRSIYFAYSLFSENMICTEKNAIEKDNVMDYILEKQGENIVEFHEDKVSEDTYAYYLTYASYISASYQYARYYFSKAPYQKACKEIAEYNKKIQLAGGLRRFARK